MRSDGGFRSLPAPALAFAVVGSLLTLGCAGFGPASFGPQTGPEAPLRVWVAEDASFATVHGGNAALIHINRPAHVAIFDVRPGLGVRAVYPATDLGGTYLQHAGLRTLHTFNAPITTTAFAGGGCWASMLSPVNWRIVVASDRPLRLGALRGDVNFPLRPGIRSLHFASGTAFQIMDAIVHALLPGARPDGTVAGGGEWDVGWDAQWVAQPCRLPLLRVATTLGTRHPNTGPPANTGEVEGGDDAQSRDREILDGFQVPEVPAIEYPVAGRVAVEPAGGDMADRETGADAREPVRDRPSTSELRPRERTPLIVPRVRNRTTFSGIRSGLNDLSPRADRPNRRFAPHPNRHRLGGVRSPGVRSGQRPTTRPKATSPRPTRDRSSSRPVRKSSSSEGDRADRPGGNGGR